MPRCHAVSGNIENAGKELVSIAENFRKNYELGTIQSDPETLKADAISRINEAIGMVDENQRELVKATECYSKAIEILEQIK